MGALQQQMRNLIFVYLVTCLVYGMTSVSSPLGTNVTLTFYHELAQEDISYNLYVLIIGNNQPFYHNDRLDPLGLKTDQDGRFTVQISKSERNLNIVVNIARLELIDEGRYVVSIAENFESPDVIHNLYETVLKVTYPPVKAECEVQTPIPPGGPWLTVQCNATLGNDDHGYICCLQNNIQMPYLQPVRHDGTQMTATFWVDPKLEVRCCSIDDVSSIDKDACDHFVYPGREDSASSISFMSTTNILSTAISPERPHDPIQDDLNAKWIVFGVFLVFLVILIVAVITWKCREKDNEEKRFIQEQVQDPFDELLPSWASKTDQRVRIRGKKGTQSPPITIQRRFERIKNKYPTKVALAVRNGLEDEQWEQWTYRHYWDDCRKVAKALIKLGIQKHQTVGICGHNSPEWVISFMGTVMAGCVSVGLNSQYTVVDFWKVVDDCKPEMIVMEDTEKGRQFAAGKEARPYPKHFVFYNSRQAGEPPDYSWSSFTDLGREVDDEHLNEIINEQAPNECCSIVYHTVLSGDLKGCMISHDNLTWLSQHYVSTLNIPESKGRFASYLPLHKIAFQLVDILLPLTSAGTTYFMRNLDDLMSCVGFVKLVRPIIFICIPAVLDCMKENITKTETRFSNPRQLVIRWSKHIGSSMNKTKW